MTSNLCLLILNISKKGNTLKNIKAKILETGLKQLKQSRKDTFNT